MITEVVAVVRKEVQQMFRGGAGKAIALAQLGAFGAIASIFAGAIITDFGSSPATVFFLVGIAGMIIISLAAETFAGEREQHTLETLLASPISSRGLVLGKYAWTVLYTVTASAIILIAGLIARMLLGIKIPPPSPSIIAAALFFVLLTSGLIAAVGIHASLRAKTTQSAAQTMGLILFAGPMLTIALGPILPSRWVSRAQEIALGGGTALVISATLVLVLCNVVLITTAIRRCRRFVLTL